MPSPLPCPFCGSENVCVVEGTTFRWVVAKCINCDAQSGEVRIQTMGSGLPMEWQAQATEDAIAEWNRRAHGLLPKG
jgi:Lar family restriction alleviation protein